MPQVVSGAYVKAFCKVGLQLQLEEVKSETACSSGGLTVPLAGRGAHSRPAFYGFTGGMWVTAAFFTALPQEQTLV